MKLSKSKLALAKVINENGGWPSDEANFAAQDKIDGESNDNTVSFYSGKVKPTFIANNSMWRCGNSGSHFMGYEKTIRRCKLLPNWHQTCISREEYYQAYPMTDDDGWIEHDGKHEPAVATSGLTLWCKWSDGLEHSHEANMVDWFDDSDVRIIAYRLHEPEIATSAREPKPVPVPEAKPTFEQLAADYRNAKDYAERKQKEADDAKADAEAKLAELVAAGKALGLVLSVAEPELVTTKFTGKFHSAKYGDRPSDLDMICDGCGKRFGHRVGFDCRP